MGARRKFTAEYKCEAVAMLETPGVTVSQVAADLGIGANILGPVAARVAPSPQASLRGPRAAPG